MLKALYAYAQRRGLAPMPGYVNKTIRAYISLSSADPDYVGIQLGDGREIPCPDIGSAAKGRDKCNALVEKRSVVIPEKAGAKSAAFLESLRSASAYDSRLILCVHALETPETAEAIREKLDQKKIKDGERISFLVDNQNILTSEAIRAWWAEYRKQFRKDNGENETLCVISGNPVVPLATVPTVHGLRVVGGHSSGDALICFDKDAFCSYGLKQGANAPVSEEAFAAVNQALEDLMKDAPILSGMKFVHWFSEEVEYDPIRQGADFYGRNEETDEDEDGWGDESWAEESVPDENPYPSPAEERQMRRQADTVPESVWSGQDSALDKNIIYHILLLSGAGGRVMIRRYEKGNYQNLRDNLERWKNDLLMVNPGGIKPIKEYKLYYRLLRLAGYRKSDKKAFERVRDELPGLTAAIVHAIITGNPLPDAVASKALAYLRSRMLSGDEDNRTAKAPDAIACQWLKVWLIRNKEEWLMREYNMDSPSVPYHCGGAMAIFAEIQAAALGDVNASVVDRYYASAIQSPALVIGQLSKLCNVHLNKLYDSKRGMSIILRNHLQEVFTSISLDELPATLELKDQSAFAVGYYQMGAKLRQEWKKRSAENKSKAAREQENSNQISMEQDSGADSDEE